MINSGPERFGTIIRYVVLGLAVHAGALSGQAEPTGRTEASAGDAPSVVAPLRQSSDVEAIRLGLSGAVRTLFAEPSQPLVPGPLAGSSGDWSQGHRWSLVHGRAEASPVLGVPASEPFESGEPRVPDEPGVWLLESAGGAAVTVIAKVPASEQQGGELNGYRMGVYPTAGERRTDAYAPPTAFIEVTPETRGLQISDHLVLGQFLTKDQFEVWPKYVALDARLIDKLELVVQELNAMGIRAEHVHVMSGFRTPQYNGPGGDGRAALSRHMWGDAADVWIDGTGDGRMDDLNGDGKVDLDDAAVVMRAVDRVESRHPELVGGAETYPWTATHGPYIHIDVRGHHSRW
ncbi:MAG: hypothetical protein WD737_04420 [Gemmatimonadota bacterium]